jgi:hypothetical protein
MLTVSIRSLNILAAVVWYLGGIVLLLKGRSLLIETGTLNLQQGWIWLAVGAAIFLAACKPDFYSEKWVISTAAVSNQYRHLS